MNYVKASVYLKNGQVIEFDAESVTASIDSATGGLQEITWTGLRGPSRPLFLDLGEVCALTLTRYSEGGVPGRGEVSGEGQPERLPPMPREAP